ncbi:Cytochrome c family protein (fragment) [Thiomonas sp. X19]|uniref:c-type cytochrome n=1 Tax=Thiomonas sp. X19 TaxID=1050370 RepID=UPI000B65067E
MRPIKIAIIFLLVETALISVMGIMFVYFGIFNISALWSDPAPVYAIFKAVRIHSIERRAANIRIPNGMDFHDPKLIRSGFNIYVRSCMICHGGPGLRPSNFVREGLNPRPPKFSHRSDLQLNPQELFWVIKNGIRMTGMPAWSPSMSDDQLWALVAFMNNLPFDNQSSAFQNK